jgi:hypothetical protein
MIVLGIDPGLSETGYAVLEVGNGRPFRAEEPRRARYDAGRCQQYFEDMRKESAWAVCGLCLYVYPHGRRE